MVHKDRPRDSTTNEVPDRDPSEVYGSTETYHTTCRSQASLVLGDKPDIRSNPLHELVLKLLLAFLLSKQAMPQGLVCIALAAAHLEAQQRKGTETSVPLTSEIGSSGDLLHNALPERHVLSNAPRVVSNGADSYDEDPIDDPEETLAKILDEQPKETPPAPSADDVIGSVQPDDVLCGRGGETNHHPGNVQYRGLVKKYQRLYLKAKRRDKPKIARLIVDTVRRRTGRFLKKDAVAGVWKDVGNNKAREKTSQALREGAPEIRDHDTKRKSIDGGSVVTPNSPTGSLPTSYMAGAGVTSHVTSGGISDVVTNYNKAPEVYKKARTDASSTFDLPMAECAADDVLNETAADDAKGAGGPRLKFLKSRFSLGGETILQQEMV